MRSNSLLISAAILVALAGCERDEPAPPPAAAPSPQPEESARPSAPTDSPSITVSGGFKPIAFFQSKCARCHGPYGSFYGEGFGKALNEDQLRTKVHDMVFGAAQSQLTDDEVAALASYHRSLSLKQPFIAVTANEPQWAGECTPGAVVEINTPTGKVAATREGHQWTAPGSADSSPMTITATFNGQQTTIPLQMGAVSAHRADSPMPR
jgi:cytochrome c553